jgi:ribosomal protein S18 acetylase RimI-like enzyme
MITLSSMTQTDFDRYFPSSLNRLTNELGKARGISFVAAREIASQSFNFLLPNGRVDSEGQYLFNIIAGDRNVGILHFGIKCDRPKPYAFIWDLEIFPEYHRKGYGKEAMICLEAKIRELNLSRIGLNVFGHNDPAIHLYKKLGYQTTSMVMEKSV